MSETQQRETELVAGVIGGITQKKADTWTVAVTPEGSQYAKNLWTKDTELVESLSAKIGQQGVFVCGASYWKRQDGTEVRSLWIDSVADATNHAPVEIRDDSSPTRTRTEYVGAPQKPAQGDGGMSKEEWARKDSAIHMMAAIKAAAAALTHTVPSDPTPEDLRTFLERTKTLSYAWWQRAEAVRKGDDSDVPFLSEADDAIPF